VLVYFSVTPSPSQQTNNSIRFKFRRDDQWTLDPDVVSSVDAFGNVNHYVVVTATIGETPGQSRTTHASSTAPAASNSAKTDAPVVVQVVRPDGPEMVGQQASISEAIKVTSPLGQPVSFPTSSVGFVDNLQPPSLKRCGSSGNVVKPAVSWISRQKTNAARWHTPTAEPDAVPSTSQPEAAAATEATATTDRFSERLRKQHHVEWSLDVNTPEGDGTTAGGHVKDGAGLLSPLAGLNARMGRSVSQSTLSSMGALLGRRMSVDAPQVPGSDSHRLSRLARRSIDSRMDADALLHGGGSPEELFSAGAIAAARERMAVANSSSAAHGQLQYDSAPRRGSRSLGHSPRPV
jgi:hypothetical protein